MADPVTAVGIAANVIQLTSFASKVLSSARRFGVNSDAQRAQQLQLLSEVTSKLKEYEAAPTFGQDKRFQECVLDSRLALDTLADSIRKLDDKSSTTKKWTLKLRKPWIQRDIDSAQQRLDALLHELQLTLSDQTRREGAKTSTKERGNKVTSPGADYLDVGEVFDQDLDSILSVELPPSDDKENDAPSEIDKELSDLNVKGISTGIDNHLQSDLFRLTQRLRHRPSTHESEPFIVPEVFKNKATYGVFKIFLEDVIIHKFTIYTVFVALVIGSAITTGFAAWTAKTSQTTSTDQLDSDFFGAISSNLSSILGVFCTVIPLLERNRQHQPDIAAWSPQAFRWCLVLSVLAAMLSMAIQTTDQASSLVFGYISTASQLIATLSLVVGSTHQITEHRRAYEYLSTQHLSTSINLMNARRQARTTDTPPAAS